MPPPLLDPSTQTLAAGDRSAGIHFDPALTTKRSALLALPIGPAIKVTLQFRDNPWTELDHGGLSNAAFLHAPAARFPTLWPPSSRSEPLITAWVGGTGARGLAGAPSSALINLALESVLEAFKFAPSISFECVAGHVHDWVADPFSSGAYCYITTGGATAPADLARTLDDKLFFAGEATSCSHIGTVEGAFQSGHAAAFCGARRDARARDLATNDCDLLTRGTALEMLLRHRITLPSAVARLTSLDRPMDFLTHYLACPPTYLSNQQPNNKVMEDMAHLYPPPDRALAQAQFYEICSFVRHHAFIHLLPPVDGLQDQVYVSNLGVTLRRGMQTIVLLSRFCSSPRRGEEGVGLRFFDDLHIPTERAPKFFEGEADLKELAPNVYVGAHGIRTSLNALRWIARRFDIEIIECELTDPHFYHLDCLFLRIAADTALVVTDTVSSETLRRIEKYVNIVSVPLQAGLGAATNCLKLNSYLICDDNRRLYAREQHWMAQEEAKLSFLDSICSKHGLVLKPFEMTEFAKSGAAMSCLFMVMPSSASSSATLIPGALPREPAR